MSPLEKLHNLTLDTLYKIHCEKTDAAAIRRELERKHLPLMSDEQIALMRKEFEDREFRFPREMRAIRDRIGVRSPIIH